MSPAAISFGSATALSPSTCFSLASPNSLTLLPACFSFSLHGASLGVFSTVSFTRRRRNLSSCFTSIPPGSSFLPSFMSAL